MEERRELHAASPSGGAIFVAALVAILGALVWFFVSENNTSTVTPLSPVPVPSTGVIADSGQDVLALANDPASLSQLEGRHVTATDVPVQSVVSDRGFWVGSTTNRIFVYVAGDPAPVGVGQAVSFSGTVTVLPVDFLSRFAIDSTHGAAQLQTEGHYLAVSGFSQAPPTG